MTSPVTTKWTVFHRGGTGCSYRTIQTWLVWEKQMGKLAEWLSNILHTCTRSPVYPSMTVKLRPLHQESADNDNNILLKWGETHIFILTHSCFAKQMWALLLWVLWMFGLTAWPGGLQYVWVALSYWCSIRLSICLSLCRRDEGALWWWHWHLTGRPWAGWGDKNEWIKDWMLYLLSYF